MKLTVFLDKQEVLAHVGWYDEEREKGVELVISIFAEMKYPVNKEQLEHTVDYVDLLKAVVNQSKIHRKLLETLASDIVEELESKYLDVLSDLEVVIYKKHITVKDYNAQNVGIKTKKSY
jgi:dihydroneopterin aldolase